MKFLRTAAIFSANILFLSVGSMQGAEHGLEEGITQLAHSTPGGQSQTYMGNLEHSLSQKAKGSSLHYIALNDIKNFHGKDMPVIENPSYSTFNKINDVLYDKEYTARIARNEKLAQGYTNKRRLYRALGDNARTLTYLQQLKQRISQWPEGDEIRNILEQEATERFGNLDTAISQLQQKDAVIQDYLDRNEQLNINPNIQ